LFKLKQKNYVFDTSECKFKLTSEDYGFVELDWGSTIIYASEHECEQVEFYVHELTEVSLLKLLRECTRKWRFFVKIKHFGSTRVAHLVSPFAYPNKLCFFPDTVNYRKVYKQLLRRLKPEELEIRKKMGEWDK
jgi:hypothetical protein